jgi:hypothetical protein
MLQMLQWYFQVYVPNVLSVSDVCCKRFIWMLQSRSEYCIYMHVANVCFKCFRCFICMLQVFYLHVAYVLQWLTCFSNVSDICYKCFTCFRRTRCCKSRSLVLHLLQLLGPPPFAWVWRGCHGAGALHEVHVGYGAGTEHGAAWAPT